MGIMVYSNLVVVFLLTGSPADHSGLLLGDTMVHVNGQNIQHLSHVDLVSVIKKVLLLVLTCCWNSASPSLPPFRPDRWERSIWGSTEHPQTQVRALAVHGRCYIEMVYYCEH